MLNAVKLITGRNLWANLHLLFWLSLIPFVTGWMGENHYARNTVVFYAILLMICGIAFTILQINIERITRDNPKLVDAFSQVKHKGIFSLVCYGLAIVLAYYNTLFSAILFCIVAIRWLIPDRSIEKAVLK
jgi:uncharacterized membrane protein